MRASSGYVSLFVLPIIVAGASSKFRPDYQFNENLDGWLKFHLVPATWEDAKLRCQLEGSELASPINEELLNALIEKINENLNPSRAVYTGVHATFSKGDYFTVKGVPLWKLPVTWAPDQPNNYDNNEDCLVLHPNGTMSDENCKLVFPYLCYKQRTDDMPQMSICGTIDPEYRYDNRTRSCYKYHRVVRTWSRAFETCAAEGGYLAIINGPGEAQIFKDLYENSPRHTGVNRHKTIVYLGFSFTGEWLTIHGQTLEEAGYAKWAKNEPNDGENYSDVGETCGSIDMGCAEIGLNDLNCGHSNPFICEMTPKGVEPNPPEGIKV